METIRNRARENLPMVLLTLLSIVQALALELLWGQIRELTYLYELSVVAATGWVQVACTLVGILLIWLNYASTAMRFRWVPSTSDSVFPFVIGVLEFAQIDSLGPAELGQWLILMGVIFAMVTMANHMIYRRARQDEDNEEWFKSVARATLADFYLPMGIVSGLTVVGCFFLFSQTPEAVALLAVVAVLGVLLFQFHITHDFWQRSMGER